MSRFLSHKRGGMELSINAIVILIIALTVLGLIIGFVRGSLGGLREKVREAAAIEVREPATPEVPLKITKTVNIPFKSRAEADVSFYNRGTSTVNVVVNISGCISATGNFTDAESQGAVTRMLPIEVKPGEVKSFRITINAGTDDVIWKGETLHTCTLNALNVQNPTDKPEAWTYAEKPLESTQFFIAVTT